MSDFYWSRTIKAKMIAWTIATRAAFVAAVVIVALLPGVSTLGALIIVAAGLAMLRSLQILFPARRDRRSNPGRGGLAGDRSPLRPMPFRPATAVERPLPPA